MEKSLIERSRGKECVIIIYCNLMYNKHAFTHVLTCLILRITCGNCHFIDGNIDQS